MSASLFAQPDFFSAKYRLEFGNYLYAEKDYLRAFHEFRNVLKTIDNDTIRFRLANSLFKISRMSEAADNFKTLFFGSALSEEARLMFYQSAYFLNDHKWFRELTEQENYQTTKYKNEVERLKSITYFYDKISLPDTNILFKPFHDSVHTRLAKFYKQKKYPQYKSPTAAAVLSSVIPGAGKIYTGEIGDAVAAFLSTAALAYLAVSNFNAEHKFRGWLFTGLTAVFYGGNIYGSAAAAQIYNARIRFNFENEVKLYFEERNYFLPRIDF